MPLHRWGRNWKLFLRRLLLLVGRWLSGETVPPLVVGTDNSPASNLDAYQWLARQQGLSLPVPEAKPSGKRVYSRFIADGGYALR